MKEEQARAVLRILAVVAVFAGVTLSLQVLIAMLAISAATAGSTLAHPVAVTGMGSWIAEVEIALAGVVLWILSPGLAARIVR
jgi:hypothetical protein